MTDQPVTPPASDKDKDKHGHAQDGSLVQTVVDEQLFIETAKDDQFAEMPGDPRSQPPQPPKPGHRPAQGAAPASDAEPPENASETSGPEDAPEQPIEGLVLGNSAFPARGN